MKIIGQLIIKLLEMYKKIKYSYIIEDAEEMRQYLHKRFKGKIALEILDGFSYIGQQGAFIGRTIQQPSHPFLSCSMNRHLSGKFPIE